MKNEAFELMVPPELLEQARLAARESGLSLADALRRSIKLGLPALRRQPARPDVGHLKPFTRAEAQRAFAPDPEWDRLEAIMASLPLHYNEEE